MNLVSGGPVGAPTFATTDRPIFAAAGEPKPLPANARLSFRQVSCGADDSGTVACFNSRDQVGFVVGPNGTYINAVNPLLDRPEGTGPWLPGMPPG